MSSCKNSVTMLGMVSVGIVVRSWLPEKRTCLIFDRSRGLIKGILFKPGSERHIQHGAFISYEVSLRGERIFLQQIELCVLPAPWARDELSFVHHVLELYALFLPPHVPDRELFTHILCIYEPLDGTKDIVWGRLIFLARFFLLIGWYPDEDACAINRLISHVPGTMVTVGEQDFMRCSLVRWLRRCVALHPLAATCKTVTFFEVVGDHES